MRDAVIGLLEIASFLRNSRTVLDALDMRGKNAPVVVAEDSSGNYSDLLLLAWTSWLALDALRGIPRGVASAIGRGR